MAPTVPLMCFSLYAALSYLAPQNRGSPAREEERGPADLHIPGRPGGLEAPQGGQLISGTGSSISLIPAF